MLRRSITSLMSWRPAASRPRTKKRSGSSRDRKSWKSSSWPLCGVAVISRKWRAMRLKTVSASWKRWVFFTSPPKRLAAHLCASSTTTRSQEVWRSFSWRSGKRESWSMRAISRSCSWKGLPCTVSRTSAREKRVKARPNLALISSCHCSVRLPGRHDQHPPDVGAQQQLGDEEAGHDGLSGARVVGQQEAQRVLAQHRLVDGGDLVGQRVDRRGVDGQHRVDVLGQADAVGLGDPLELLSRGGEAPGAGVGGGGQGRLMFAEQGTAGQRPGGGLVDHLQRFGADHLGADHPHRPIRDDAGDGHVLADLFELQHSRGPSKGPTSRPMIPLKTPARQMSGCGSGG